MAGGSALKKLKEKATAEWKEKKQAKVTKANVPRKAPESGAAFNPFDLKITRLKHDVLGRRPKGMMGKPAVSKKKGIETRQKTLLPEMETLNKSSVFVDKRIGENDSEMTVEEKMAERFMRERNLMSKKRNIYNLEDANEAEDDEEDLVLTHGGKAIDEIENFDDIGGSDDDEEEEKQGLLNKSIVNQMHFSGFDEQQNDNNQQPKSRGEVMKEIIAKSKMHKYLNQKVKEENTELCEELNRDFDSIRSLLAVDFKNKDAPTMHEERIKYNEDLNYDAVVRELVYEKRAHATDRIKTEEELAKEEFEKLQEQERDRLKRMNGLVSEDEDEDADKGKRKCKKAKTSADSLYSKADDEEEEEEDSALVYKDGVLVNKSISFSKTAKRKSDDSEDGSEEDSEQEGSDDEDVSEGFESEDDEESGEEEESESDEGEDSELDEEEEEDSEDDEEESEGSESADEESSEKNEISEEKLEEMMEAAKKELPYVIEMPANHSSFLELVKVRPVEEHIIAIKRIQSCHHASLGEERKKKLEKLLVLCLEHYQYLCRGNGDALPAEPLNELSRIIYGLAQQFPMTISKCSFKILELLVSQIKKEISQRSLKMPNAVILSLFKLFGVLFSTSDFKHPIITPSFLVLCCYLNQAVVSNIQDVISGIFVCEILLSYVKGTKRYIPEVINFLYNVVDHYTANGGDDKSSASFPKRPFGQEILNHLDTSKDEGKSTLFEFSELMKQKPQIPAASSILQKVFSLLETCLDYYGSSDAAVELFSPLSNMLANLKEGEPKALSNILSERLNSTVNLERAPLKLQTFKAQPIVSYDPDFDLDYNPDRKKSGDKAASEAAKLRHEYKKEFKGAMRELRKDTAFIAQEQAKKRKVRDEAYNQKIKSIYGRIANEGGEIDKAKKKKRK